MLADAAAIEVVADRLARHPEIAKVVDPVMVATSGAKLIADDAVATLTTRLLPCATLITPNLPEAEVLWGRAITCRNDVREAAARVKDFVWCIFKPEPTYLGEAIPIWSSGALTDDRIKD